MIKLLPHYLYWILIFLTGIVQLLHLNTAIYKIGIPLVALLMFAYQFIERAGDMKYPFWHWILVFTGVSVVSAHLNQMDTFSLINFLIYTILSYAYFVVLVNEQDLSILPRVVRFIKILIFIQIPAIMLKFILVGQSEGDGIGTLSENGGSISTIFPLFMITFLFCLYLFKEKKIYILYLLSFVFFAIVGDKRAILFYVPFMILFSYLLFVRLNRTTVMNRITAKLLVAGVFSCIIFFLVVKTNRTLNPENSRWGSFDIEYLTKYVKTYTGSGDKDVSEMRRKDGLIYFVSHAFSGDLEHVLLGDGAGKLIQSRYNTRSGQMKDEYGIRYGGRMGIVWMLLQVGVLGTLLYLSLIISMIVYVFRNYKDSPIYLAFLAVSVVFFIDMFTYSYVFLRFEYLKGLYFVLFALIYLDVKYKTMEFSNLAKLN
jgi:hypothetical protein